MADVNGLVSDPDFQKLDPASQRQALAGVTGDQSFSSLSDADTQQFITRLSAPSPDLKTGQGMEQYAQDQARQQLASNVRPIAATAHDQIIKNQIARAGGPQAVRQKLIPLLSGLKAVGYMAGVASAGIGAPSLAEAAPIIARTALGGAAGSYAGHVAGGDIGSVFGPRGREVGADIGSVVGGLYGGGTAASLERNPTTPLQSFRGQPGSIKPLPFGIQRFIPEWMVPTGEPGSPTNAGWYDPLNYDVEPVKPLDELAATQAASGNSISQTSSNPGTLSSVSLIPEPRPSFEGENPDYMASIPRGKLQRLANSGKPGAATQLQQLGNTVIYQPRSTVGYPGSTQQIPTPEELPSVQLDPVTGKFKAIYSGGNGSPYAPPR